MNESDLTTVLERAGHRLHPDVDALVAGGVRRGRRRRRRGVALAGAGAAAVVALVAALLLPTGQSTVARDPGWAGTGSAAQPGSQRALADATTVEKRLRSLLPAGKEVNDLEVTDEQEPGLDGTREIELHLDGAQVQISVYDFTMDPKVLKARLGRDPGPRPADCTMRTETGGVSQSLDTPDAECRAWQSAQQDNRCAASAKCLARATAYSPDQDCKDMSALGPGQECRELSDGSWVWTRAGSAGDGSGGSADRMTATAHYTTDGWYVDVSAFTVDDSDSFHPQQMADEPPLTLEQTTTIATSDLWFA